MAEPRTPFSFEGETVALLGANGLIGRAAAAALLDLGAQVVAGGRSGKNDTGLEHPRLRCLPADLTDEASVESYLDAAERATGRLDALVNCAWPPPNYSAVKLEEIRLEEMADDLRNHLLGYFSAARSAFRRFESKGGGRLVLCGSIYGELAPDFRVYEGTALWKDPTYAMIKAGIHGLTRFLAALGAPKKIRVNCVAAGGVFNRQDERFVRQYAARVPLGRMADPSDIAWPLAFLASNASAYMTGQTVFVDGGLNLW